MLSDPIKSIGSFEVPVKLHKDVTARLAVKVVEGINHSADTGPASTGGSHRLRYRRRGNMEEALIKRVLPHSLEAEQSVIGSMLMDREAVIAASEM